MARVNLVGIPSALPETPYPADITANGWRPEFDLARIVASDTWTLAEDDERPWLLRIWMEAWASRPVGSMPSDRRLFARRIGCKAAFLDAHAEILLRGWTRHEDGLLYHCFITSQVLSMLEKRRKTANKVARWRNGRESVTGYNEPVTGYQPVSNRQEQEQEHVLRRLTPSSSPSDNAGGDSAAQDEAPKKPTKADACPLQQIVDRYNEILGTKGWQRCLSLNEQRKRALRARWVNDLDTLEHWAAYFERISSSDFLMSRTRSPFRNANLNWLLSPTNLDEIIEGKYDNAR